MLKMNRPEWVYILFGCVACFCTGGFQPGIGVIISKIIAVRIEKKGDYSSKYLNLLIGVSIM